MRLIKAIVVDDEVLGRARVKKLISATEHVQLVGEARNGTEAREMILNYRPDLVFMDIEMPDKSGMQVITSIPEEDRPFVIFVTAHPDFALKAFDVQAVDYLRKPYDNERFHQAVRNAQVRVEEKEKSKLNDQLIEMVEAFRSQSQSNPFVLTIKEKGRDRQVNLYDVHYIESDGNYLKLQLENERFLIRGTMQQLQTELDGQVFLRIHRSLILNTNYIKVKTYRGNNEFCFKMRDGMEFTSGRSFKEEIDNFFN